MKFSQLFRIYVNQTLAKNQIICLIGERQHYLASVIRLKIDQKIRIFNERDGEFVAQVKSIGKKETILVVEDSFRSVISEPTLILALCIIKLDRFLEAIRAAVQIGVTEIIPIVSSRVQLRKIPREKIENILQQSTEQSERLRVPILADETPLEDLLQKQDIEQIIFANENETENKIIADISDWKDKLCVLIGPEGGFTEQEVKLLDQANITSISLGETIMRSEIATIVTLGCVKMMRNK
jgi:16S rRNA (uracil1498-N3)-methyltransferase